MTTQFQTKSAAVAHARALRAAGTPCKVLRHAGAYSQPGRGFTGYVYYTVQVQS